MKQFLLTVFFLLTFFFEAQEKTINAVLTPVAPRIDGLLTDSCWSAAEVAGDFIQRDLHPGEPAQQKSEVRFLYDNTGIYIAAQLYDTAPDSILRELSVRDNEANAELFGVFFDTYNDDINAFGFFVTSAGTQIDARYSADGQDFDWNAVWMSAAKVNEKGWAVEMRIPYSALRFSAKTEQVWGMNIVRKIRRYREMSFWNTVDPKINSIVRQFGKLEGLRNLKPPVRLSFTPYVASIINHYPYNDPAIKNLNYNFSGGMDLKYGLSDAFTLDMTLVPDFSQVQSDNQVLNLTQFEIQFQERRTFFTEGTELFNKGGLFYSRRVGGTPFGYGNAYRQLRDGERVLKNPGQTQLLNATKLSGRTSGKLGVGLFNALSNNTYATLQDSAGETRQVMTAPLTNYNIVVLDQALKNNSSVSFINTNVMREGRHYDANVSGGLFRFNNRENTYTIGGRAVMSNRFYPDSALPYTGYSSQLDFGKNGGNFRWSVHGSVNSDRYNPNDLGILIFGNNADIGLNVQYNIYKPFWKVNNFFNRINFVYQRMYLPNAFANFGIHANHNTTFTKRFFTCGINYHIEPVITYDYYEARVPGRFYTYPVNGSVGGFFSSDYRKPFALDMYGMYRRWNSDNRNAIYWELEPRLRVSNRLSLFYEFSQLLHYDNIGFANYDVYTDTITFGRRDLQTINNVVSAAYKFTNKMSLTFRLRHYWSSAKYLQYYTLQKDGYLAETGYSAHHDVNFNAFNIDMVFFWQFAPGSELNIVWKNSLLKSENAINADYYNNFRGSLNSPQNNMVSVKVLYYIDYDRVRDVLKKTP